MINWRDLHAMLTFISARSFINSCSGRPLQFHLECNNYNKRLPYLDRKSPGCIDFVFKLILNSIRLLLSTVQLVFSLCRLITLFYYERCACMWIDTFTQIDMHACTVCLFGISVEGMMWIFDCYMEVDYHGLPGRCICLLDWFVISPGTKNAH